MLQAQQLLCAMLQNLYHASHNQSGVYDFCIMQAGICGVTPARAMLMCQI